MAGQLQLSVVQVASEHLEPAKNLRHIREWARREAEWGCDLLVFPELVTTGYIEPVSLGEGYSPEVTGDRTFQDFVTRYASLATPVPGPTTDELQDIAQESSLALVVGLLERCTETGLLANTVVVVDPSGLRGAQRKIHMPWNEKHVFVPGNRLETIPVCGVKVGICVCYDAYFPEQSRILALKGADLLIACFTGPRDGSSNGAIDVDRATVVSRMRALENGLPFVAVNRTGSQGKYRFIGNSAIAGPSGRILAASDTEEEEALRVTLDIGGNAAQRVALPVLKDRRPELYEQLSTMWDSPHGEGGR